MSVYEEKFAKLRSMYLTEEDQIRIGKWEKLAHENFLTSSLAQNDAFKLLIQKYKAEKEKIRKMLSENKSLFANPEGMMLGQLAHSRVEFIDEFLAIFTKAENAGSSLGNTLDKALATDDK